jgi:hypothetical protein
MTDANDRETPDSEESATLRRRPRRRAGTTTAARARRRGTDLVESLRRSVEQLIQENRELKRQLARVIAGGGTSAVPAAERTLRSIQRKVLRAVSSDGAPRRRSRGDGTATGRSRTAATAAARRRRASRGSADRGE